MWMILYFLLASIRARVKELIAIKKINAVKNSNATP